MSRHSVGEPAALCERGRVKESEWERGRCKWRSTWTKIDLKVKWTKKRDLDKERLAGAAWTYHQHTCSSPRDTRTPKHTANSCQFPDCATHLPHMIATTCSLPRPLDRGKPHLSKDAGKPRPSEPVARKAPWTHIHTQHTARMRHTLELYSEYIVII